MQSIKFNIVTHPKLNKIYYINIENNPSNKAKKCNLAQEEDIGIRIAKINLQKKTPKDICDISNCWDSNQNSQRSLGNNNLKQ